MKAGLQPSQSIARPLKTWNVARNVAHRSRCLARGASRSLTPSGGIRWREVELQTQPTTGSPACLRPAVAPKWEIQDQMVKSRRVVQPRREDVERLGAEAWKCFPVASRYGPSDRGLHSGLWPQLVPCRRRTGGAPGLAAGAQPAAKGASRRVDGVVTDAAQAPSPAVPSDAGWVRKRRPVLAVLPAIVRVDG